MTKRILVVDDDFTITNLLKEYLELEGYQVIIASNGKEALLLVEKNSPDLLISDIKMPYKDGYDLVKELRQNPLFSLLPVIFLTSQNSWENKIQGYDSGCDIFLTKPFHPPELIAIIHHLLGRWQLENDSDNFIKNDHQFIQSLTERETEILQLLVKGYSNIVIAEKLYLSPKTVEKYVSTLLHKAEVNNRTELAIFAYKNKLIT